MMIGRLFEINCGIVLQATPVGAGCFILAIFGRKTHESRLLRLWRDSMKTTPFALTKREAMVIAMRFGLDGHRDHTLEEVGHQFGVTRERIRQIEAKALRKLRKNKKLLSFWSE